MTGRGTDIFQECRLGLVRIGEPAVDPVIELLQGKNAEVQEMAAKYKFDKVTPGVVPYKAAYLLGDLRAEKAVPLLIARLGVPAQGERALGHPHRARADRHAAEAVDALVAVLKNAKAEPALRASAADALYMTGDRRAVPTLLEIAKSGYVTVGGQKASDLRANAAIDFARLAGPEHFDAFKALADKETEAQGVFGEALDRLQVAKECGSDLACYGKTLQRPVLAARREGGLRPRLLGRQGGRARCCWPPCSRCVTLAQDRYPVHQAMLFALVRLADKTCKECEEKLDKQIERDEKAVRLPGARSLLAETRVALAQIQNTEPGRPAKAAALADGGDAAPAGAGRQGQASKGGKKRQAGEQDERRIAALRQTALLLDVLDDDGGVDAAADVEVAFDAGAAGVDGGDQVLEDAVGDRLVEGALVAVRPEVELPGLQLDAQPVGDVFDADGGEVGLPGLGAQAGELGRLEADDVVPPRVGVGEGLQGLGGPAGRAGRSCGVGSDGSLRQRRDPVRRLQAAQGAGNIDTSSRRRLTCTGSHARSTCAAFPFRSVWSLSGSSRGSRSSGRPRRRPCAAPSSCPAS